MTAPRLFAVLVTFRRPELLGEALAALERQDRRPDVLVVVDNDASPVAREIVDAHGARYVAAPENLGPAGGIALGMAHVLREAGPDDWVLLLDDDDMPPPDVTLGDLWRFARARSAADPMTAGVGLVGARFDWGRARIVRIPDDEIDGPVAVDYLGGNHLPLYRVDAVRRAGGFRDDLFFGYDDLEFGLRLRAAGYRLYVEDRRWPARRTRWGRTGVRARSRLRLGEPSWRRYYGLRNLVFILRRHRRSGVALRVALLRGLGKPIANLPRDPRRALRHLRLNWAACRDGWTGRMGRTVEPDLDAAAELVSAKRGRRPLRETA